MPHYYYRYLDRDRHEARLSGFSNHQARFLLFEHSQRHYIR